MDVHCLYHCNAELKLYDPILDHSQQIRHGLLEGAELDTGLHLNKCHRDRQKIVRLVCV